MKNAETEYTGCMKEVTYIDIVMGSFGVCLYRHNSVEIYTRAFDFYHEQSKPTSQQHLIFRLMRSLRDILAQFKQADIRSSQVRVVYSGECSFAEPVHTNRTFPNATLINEKVTSSVIQGIMVDHRESTHGEYSICGYVLNGISTRGFEYDGDERVTEATFHGVVTYCDRELRLWVERTLFLAGATVIPVRHRAQSSMIPSVLMEMLLNKSKGMVLVYEIGALHSMSSQWTRDGLVASTVASIGQAALLTPLGQAKLVEDILHWCKEPKGSVEVVFMVDAHYYGQITHELDSVMHKVQHLLPYYTFGAMVYALDYTNPEDVYRIFKAVYGVETVDSSI
jgi:hypothetical protein